MITKLSISAAIGAASIIGIIAFGTSAASAKSVTSCQAGNGSSVVSCCEKIVANKGMPNWMMQGNFSCREVVKCAPVKSASRCYIQPRSTENTNGGNKSDDRGGGQAT